jgi:hypothetical protein
VSHTFIQYKTCETVISLSQRLLPTPRTTTQEIKIHALHGIQTHDSSNQAVSILLLRLRPPELATSVIHTIKLHMYLQM